MNSNRLWILGGVVMAVAVAVLAWLVGISPQLDQAATADEQKTAAQQQLQASQVQLAKLKKDYASIGELKQQLATLQASVPGEPEVTDFVRQLSSQASSTHTTLTSITVGEPTAYAPQSAAGSTAASSGTASSTATPAPTANATAAAVAPPLTTDPSITTSNFLLLPVTLAASGDYASLMDFTQAVQQDGPRLFLVDKLDVQKAAAAATDGSSSGTSSSGSATVAGYIYVLVGNGS
ncbi:hypothetical protein [Gryllotalpicola ginsengisoli]|uniref:hypothetical protein n=1 Tax=Gryllotalpicola ginsengisoli TaxID=444608 RepID=UPI00041127FA|nr:hypothetical protein [Gryllotalpicola ginsengisoli]